MAAIKSGAQPKLKLAPNLAPRLAWQTRRLLRQAGPGAVAGIACALLAVLAQWHATQLDQRQATLTRQLNAAARAAAAPHTPAPTAAGGVAAFYAYLPAHEAIPDQLKELVKVAQQSGIALNKAEYKPEMDTKAGFLRYRITLPVKADYASVQTFIIGALQALPTLTLDSVAFKREQIESGEIDARIQFVLLVRQEARR
ncbi:type 4a pilus biogenesis protein PilO [Duganella sp. BJB1802]|uniref:type 4a pilus biogenesis protein PilO n=1 Tax=Duganella sp. BJB1802 TaxID=2744575 RepID=UPI001594132D|nr:type 4a pilus biogenesis protein PilO [Duganella sp. BJB1802]NVD69239.1 type 4a pilus biogenesis protein PilO [Duganella sp. BJB1802]